MGTMSKQESERHPVTGGLRKAMGVGRLEDRVRALEAQVDDYRQAHLRLAELVDLVQELLLPMAQQDREKVDRLIERYTDQLEA